jgi:hypothetical protein
MWELPFVDSFAAKEDGRTMVRQRALRVVLVLVGLFFSAAAYPAIGGLFDPVNSDTGDTMQMAIYACLGVFLLIAARNPSAHRSLIAFAAWSSFAHAAVMGTLGLEIANMGVGFLITSGILIAIGVALLVLLPRKQAQQGIAAAA